MLIAVTRAPIRSRQAQRAGDEASLNHPQPAKSRHADGFCSCRRLCVPDYVTQLAATKNWYHIVDSCIIIRQRWLRNCPIWARSLVDPASLENEQIRLG